MANAQEVWDEIEGKANHHEAVMGENGPNPRIAKTLQDKATTAAHEVTLWLPGRDVETLLAQEDDNDTTLGHAIRAASWGYHNYRLLKAIDEKLDRLLDQ